MKKAPVKKRTLPTRSVLQNIKKRAVLVSSKTIIFIDRKPLTSFFAILALVLVLIFVGNFLNKPKPVTEEQLQQIKSISAYHIGTAPKITVSAQTKKSGVIEIVALSGGVIDKLNVQEGAQVNAGDILVSLSSNYKGENTLTLQRQIAATQYQGVLATFPKQKETIERQKELAEKTEEDSEELRKILEQSLGETRTLLSANEEALRLLEEQIKDAENAPAPDIDAIRKLKQQRGGFTNSVNQARQQLRKDEYNADGDKPAAEKVELTKEITKRQLDVELKQLEISLAVSGLQANLARINESNMFPSAPFAGTIQRVFVKEKQQVGVGDSLLVISQAVQDKPITAVAYVSADVAKRISRFEPSTLHIGDKVSYISIPSFVSTEAVQGTLYAVYYPIPPEHSSKIVSDGFISIDMPIGMADTTMIATYVPLDAVYQTREKAYVFVVNGDTAKSRDVQLGQVYGDSVEIVAGLKNGDTVILNRNIIAGDKIQIQ